MSTTSLQVKLSVAALATILIIGVTYYVIKNKEKKNNKVLTRKKSMLGKRPSVKMETVVESANSKYIQPGPNKATLHQNEELQGRLLEDVSIKSFRIHDIPNLMSHFSSANVANDLKPAYNKILGEQDFVVGDIVRKFKGNETSEAFVRAGPRRYTHFDPTTSAAAIVTCGGLCPGLNNVIRELVHALIYLYGVKKIYGIRGGYNGFLGGEGYDPILLDESAVDQIHHQGGTILASSRGGFDLEKILEFIKKHGINQMYIIGGDGTHRGAYKISQECIARGLNVAIVGIPKTIDNDIDLIDRSFGFTTSVEAAQAAIVSAKTEAKCNMPNGIGIVKLMGRSAGFIATHATLASGDVDLCLVPEVSIELEGPNGCLKYLENRIKEQGHAVVVVAEGAGEDLLGQSAEVDAGGNRKLPAIGEFLKTKISEYFKSKGMEATVKYIDPSYMIRYDGNAGFVSCMP